MIYICQEAKTIAVKAETTTLQIQNKLPSTHDTTTSLLERITSIISLWEDTTTAGCDAILLLLATKTEYTMKYELPALLHYSVPRLRFSVPKDPWRRHTAKRVGLVSINQGFNNTTEDERSAGLIYLPRRRETRGSADHRSARMSSLESGRRPRRFYQNCTRSIPDAIEIHKRKKKFSMVKWRN